jgi:ABC-2 type transport system permease protein
MRHALRILGVQMRINTAAAMQYRADFVIQGVMAIVWVGVTLLPLTVLFGDRVTVAGWDYPSALVLIAYFTALRAILEGVIGPSLVDVVERIRSGAFDYVLLKPVDAQLMVAWSRVEPWKIVDVLAAIGLGAYAFWLRGSGPSAADVAAGLVLLAAGTAVMYSLWIVCCAASFWVVKLDNLTYLLTGAFDVARWPVQIFRGAWRLVFTLVIPVALMTTYPAMAMLGRLDGGTLLATIGGAILALGTSRLIWRTAIRSYTSASS